MAKKKKRSAAQRAATRKMRLARAKKFRAYRPGSRKNQRTKATRTRFNQRQYKRIGAQPLSKLEEKHFRDYLLSKHVKR